MQIQNSLLKCIFLVLIAGIVITGCEKDKYTTKPQLEFKSLSSYNVPIGGLFTFDLGFTDKEGDLTDSIFIQEIALNCPASNLLDQYRVPLFPSKANQKGNFNITFVNTTNIAGYKAWPSPQCQKPDTAIFRFWIRDKAGNVSDTITIDRPMIIQN